MQRALKLLLVVPLFGLTIAPTVHAQTPTLQELFGFSCPSPFLPCPDGKSPDALILASDGNFYGAAEYSNTPTGIKGGGKIFKMTPAGQVTVIYTFPQNQSTGLFPNGDAPASIAEGSDGLLYGVAPVGGPTSASAGTLWRVSKTGTGFQVLQTFCTTCTNGGFPDFIMAASDGNLYGTTSSGGKFAGSECQNFGCGVVFRLTTGGVYTVLHAFNGTSETSYPAGLTQASDGNLYGSTAYEGGGAIFKVTLSGQFSTLATLPGGAYALAPVTEASNGLLYGYSHVVSSPNVELVSCTVGGSLQTVAQITQPLFKQYGMGQILQASDGNLWAAAFEGGTSSYGRLLAVSTNGTIVQSLSFTGKNGSGPTGQLVQAANGTLYGTTTSLGTLSNGNYASGEIYTVTGLPAR
jgi:uncharacterized repeat protein (TIGR03803 family)